MVTILKLSTFNVNVGESITGEINTTNTHNKIITQNINVPELKFKRFSSIIKSDIMS